MTENLGDMISRLHNLKESLKETRASIRELEYDVIQEMVASGQTLFEDTRFKARLPVERDYDVHKFKAVMGEVLSPEQFNKVYSPF